MKILIIKFGALGDMVLATSAFKAIRRFHPTDHITLLTTAPYASFAKKTGYFDEVWVGGRPGFSQIKALWKVVKALRQGGYDRVYDLQNVDRTKLYHRLMTLAKPVEWVGFHRAYSHAHTPPSWHQQDRFDSLLQSVGMPPIEPLDIGYMAEDVSSFALPERYAVLVPSCSAEHRHEKCWPVERFQQAIQFFQENKLTPVIVGGPGEDNSSLVSEGVMDLTGKTSVLQLIGVMKNASFVLGNDSGPSHMAVATHRPTVMLYFGRSDPAIFGHRDLHCRCLYAAHPQGLNWETARGVLQDLLFLCR